MFYYLTMDNCFCNICFRMADVADIVFRWEIPDAATKFATGKVESGEFNGGGFRWAAAMSRCVNYPDDTADFTLRCGVDDNGPWKCEVEMEVCEVKKDGSLNGTCSDQARYCFDENNAKWVYSSGAIWSGIINPAFHVDGKATFEVQLRIISSQRVEPIAHIAMFDTPNKRSDVILLIGERKLHVSREYLAIHSPVFEAMFFGDYAEKGKEEVEIKDVVYEEFRDLLHLIYFATEITDRNVQHILKLTDRFQMELVMNQAKKHLIQTKGIDTAKKLLLADQYRITSLKDHCLESYTKLVDITEKLMSAPEYDEFSDGLKVVICDRIKNLSRKQTAVN